MPHPFLPEHTQLLKQTMIPRAPACIFTDDDIAVLGVRTGLDAVQVRKWADRLRARVTRPEERLVDLQYIPLVDAPAVVRVVVLTTLVLKLNFFRLLQSTNAHRFYVTGFNLNEELLRAFIMPKARSSGIDANFEIKYMDAAIDDDAYAAEFFIEFIGLVWQHKLLARLEDLGAGSVYIGTFAHADQNKSAADCLVRIWREAAKTKAYQRGVCTPALLARATAKLQSEGMSQAAFDEKTARGIQASLGRIDEGLAQTNAGVTTMTGNVDAMAVEVTAMHDVLTQLRLAEIECRRLRDLVEEKTLLADRVEYSKGGITRERNEALAKVVAADRIAEQSKYALEYERMLSAGVIRENDMLRTQVSELRAQVRLILMRSQRDHQQTEDLRAQAQRDHQQIDDLRQQVSALRGSP